MATPKWEPGKLYLPGSLVVPRTDQPTVSTAITNPGFESGATDWTLGVGVTITSSTRFSGTSSAQFSGTGGLRRILHDAVPCSPGTTITASCMYQQGAASSGQNVGRVILQWLDGADAVIREDEGTLITSSSGGWQRSTASAKQAPAGTESVKVGGLVNRTNGEESWMDAFAWDYATATAPLGLVFKATQAAAGVSDSEEPIWPLTVGVPVTDNEVIWEGFLANRVVWQASPIMVSGATEPTWPEVVGDFVADGTISWKTISRRVEDTNCPNTRAVAILASKVFATDKDIIRFSATTNPLDWTSEKDAGYLPSGLQQANSNDMAVLQPYRSNLGAFNSSSFQNWQVDPNPAEMAILDQMDGVGSTWQKAACAVGNELFYLSQQGYRTVGIANAAENLRAGDVGMPIDPIVALAINAAVEKGINPISTYYPGAGQFWGAFPNYPNTGVTTVFVYSMTQAGKPGAWSRYVFPFAIESFALRGNDLFIRHGNKISRASESAVSDTVDGLVVNFPGVVWWPWLDFGQPGVTKMLEGFDYVGTGQGPSISIGYDQRNLGAFTPPYQLDNDTLPGGIIPLPVSAPSFSVKLEFAGGEKWNMQSVLLGLFDLGNGP